MEQLVLEYELSGGGLQAIAQQTQPPGHCRVWSNSSVSPLLMLRSPHNTSKGMGTSGPNKSSCGNLSPPMMLDCRTDILLGTACCLFSKGMLCVPKFLGVKRGLGLSKLRYSF